jgi:hypothetical protein
MAFVTNYNQLDDKTETTGSTTGLNVAPIVSTADNTNPENTVQSDGLYNTAVQPGVTAISAPSPSANATKGSGFTNLSTYLDANKPGADALGTQVAGNVNAAGNNAMTKMQNVNAWAESNPTGDLYNTQEAKDAQGAITSANDKAKLTQNVGGQTALIKDLNPNVTTGGANLDQNLMGNSQRGMQQVTRSAQAISPLQDLYTKQASTLQENAQLRQALARLQQQNMGSQTNPTTTQTYGGTDQVPNSAAGAVSPGMQGLSADQLAYLKTLQGNAATGGAAGLGALANSTSNSIGNAISNATAGMTDMQKAAVISGLVTQGIISSSYGNSYLNDSGGGKVGTSGGTNANGGTGGVDSVGTGLGGFSLDANGNVTANTTGISNTTANVIGSIIGAITGIPGLGYLGSYLNNKTNNTANSSASSFGSAISDSNPNTNGTIGNNTNPTATAGQNGTGGTAASAAAAAASAAASQGLSAEAQGAAAQAAANAVMSGMSPADAAAAAAAAASAADPAGQQAVDSAVQAAADAAAADNAANAGPDPTSADVSAASDASDSTSSDSTSSDSSSASSDSGSASSDSGSSSTGGGDKDGGFIRGPGTSRSDSIPRMLSNGEYVINAKVVAALGKDFFDKLNNSVK